MRDGAKRARRLLGETAGAQMTEYVLLTALVGLLIAFAAVAVGVPLVRSYQYSETVLLLPGP